MELVACGMAHANTSVTAVLKTSKFESYVESIYLVFHISVVALPCQNLGLLSLLYFMRLVSVCNRGINHALALGERLDRTSFFLTSVNQGDDITRHTTKEMYLISYTNFNNPGSMNPSQYEWYILLYHYAQQLR